MMARLHLILSPRPLGIVRVLNQSHLQEAPLALDRGGLECGWLSRRAPVLFDVSICGMWHGLAKLSWPLCHEPDEATEASRAVLPQNCCVVSLLCNNQSYQ